VEQIYGGILQIVALHAIKRPQRVKVKYQLTNLKKQNAKSQKSKFDIWFFFGHWYLRFVIWLYITVSIKHPTPAGNDYYCMYNLC